MKRKDLFNNSDITDPKASNKTGAYGTFYFRDVYDSFVFKDAEKDLWYVDSYYGRINHAKEVVIPSEKNLKQLSNDEKTILVLPPVALAWRSLLEYVEKAKFRGDMNTEDSLYSDLKPTFAWASPHKYYTQYNGTMYDSFSGKFMTSHRDRKIKDFDGFLEVFVDFAERTFKKVPWTREGYLMSNRATPHFSGMCIEVAEAPHDLDSLKARFLADNNFKFFRKAAHRHGFQIDKNAPWRLLADLDSKGMKRYMKRSGTSREDFYDDYFIKSYEWELQNFKHYLWGWYNNYVNANPVVQVVDSTSRKTKLDLVVREAYTEEELFQNYSDHFFMKLYVYVRAIETNKQWSQSTYDAIVYKARDFLRLKGLNIAMKYLHKNIEPCAAQKTKELFDKKSLTSGQVDVILRERNKQNKLSFSYY